LQSANERERRTRDATTYRERLALRQDSRLLYDRRFDQELNSKAEQSALSREADEQERDAATIRLLEMSYDDRHHRSVAWVEQAEHQLNRSRELSLRPVELRAEERTRQTRRARVSRHHRSRVGEEFLDHELIAASVSLRHRLAIKLSSRNSKSLFERTNRSYAVREERARRALRCLRGESECVRARARVDVVDERREQRLLCRVRSAAASTQSN